MEKKLYFIENQGCDATTYGLVEISDEEFPNFKSSIENLNKNSYYGCMPVISVYRIDRSAIKKVNINPDLEPWDDGYVQLEDRFYLNGKIYTFAEQYFHYRDDDKCVIKGR